MTDTDEPDKKKIKIEEASEEIASQPNQTATVHEQEPSQQNPNPHQNQAPELISTESGHSSALVSDTDTVASVSLPTTVITTQRHRMITTTGQIR